MSTSKSESSPTVVSDSGRAAGKKGVYTESGGLNLGKGAKYTAGSDLTRANLGNQVKAGGNVSMTIGDPEAARTIANTSAMFADTLKSVTESGNAKLESAFGSQASQLSAALGQVGTLSEGKQTEGTSYLTKSFLWGLAIVAGAFVVWLIFRK